MTGNLYLPDHIVLVGMFLPMASFGLGEPLSRGNLRLAVQEMWSRGSTISPPPFAEGMYRSKLTAVSTNGRKNKKDIFLRKYEIIIQI